ncbi:uncharacterized protein BP5553_03567 [Venustampulla echinocandica]|uniref:Uncharacterized protein n=1 Tax=Venustampulla echinocandica TaxID=2656787 RepID=A0A370TUM2_9HELO|nr:uncharacterized protein BP5553_03567 [Venustampulla echinocandica]RDL39227.1 hypothetical protein BP5553_03567 [Venustampulla echinocandica]
MWSSLQYALLLCLAGANALPHIAERDIPADQLTQFKLLAQYAGAAYCYTNVHSTGKKVSCSVDGGSCPAVESSQTSITASFIAGGTRTTGYVTVDDTHKLIVVSIQGTSISTNPIDVLTNLDVERDKTSICGTANKNDGCSIHGGFNNAANDALGPVKAAVATAKAAHPDYKIATTGHSLGGAVAAILGALLRNSGNNVDIVRTPFHELENIQLSTNTPKYTFGQPHIGTVDINNYIQSQAPAKGNNYRVTHFNDIVPQLPPHFLGDWDHFYPEFWINLKSGNVGATNVKVVQGSLYSTAGNEGATTGRGIIADIIAGIPAHDDYFGEVSTC